MSKKQKPPIPRCALCRREINIPSTDYVVGITGKIACRNCLRASFHIFETIDEPEEAAPTATAFITPQYIIRELDKAIIGQKQAKEAVALAVWKQMLRANGEKTVPRTNLLLYGPSGCGKTAIIRQAAAIVGLPFLTVDATSITETGYRGKDASDIITDLLAMFKDHPHIKHAIVLMDETDKLAAYGNDGRQAYCQGTQYALLKRVEGMEVTTKDGVTMDTSIPTT